MKININKVRIVPKNISKDFQLCVFGQPSEEVNDWIIFHNLLTSKNGQFTNINIPDDILFKDLFVEKESFKYMDGFSPNLNKHLHIGHLSNLVLAKSFWSMSVANNTVSIYGDTLDGEVSKKQALSVLDYYCSCWDYVSTKKLFASEMKYSGDLLIDGSGEYEGTKIFDIEGEKIVGIKSRGHTTYFYQDIALAEYLNAPTLYLTGKEQCNHFNLLKKLYPNNQHVGLGLVKAQGQKMASRIGNVIFIDDLISQAKEMFGDNMQLIYNVFAGHILKSTPESDKNINLDQLNNPKTSGGLYISYTMARMKSAGLDFTISKCLSKKIEFSFMKAKENLSPNILFDCVIDVCKDISALYVTHTIKDNPKNKEIFQGLLSDMLWACDKLGIFQIYEV